MMNQKRWIPSLECVLFFIIGFFSLSSGASESLQASSIERLNLSPSLKILFDKENKTLDEIASQIAGVPQNNRQIIKVPHQSGDIWLATTLTNSQKKTLSLYLQMSPIFTDVFQIYLKHSTAHSERSTAKYIQVSSDEKIISRRPTLHFNLPPESTSEILIKYKPIKRNNRDLVFTANLYNDLQFQYSHALNLALLSALFGGLILAAFFCGVAYFQVGLKPYLNFQFFIISVLVTLFCFEGLIHYFSVDYSPIDIFVVGKLASYVMGIFLIQLGYGLIYESNQKSFGRTLLNFFVGFLWLGLIPVYFGYVRFIFDLTTLAVMMSLVLVSLNIAYREHKAHLYFFGIGLGIQFSAMLSFSLLDNIDSSIYSLLGQQLTVLEFKRVVFHVGTLLNILFLAVAINVQVRRIKEQRDKARKQEQALQGAYQHELETTVKQRTEEIHQKNLTLKSLDAAKSRFFATISHEFRTPIALISGPASLLLNGEFGVLSKPVKEQLTLIDRNGKRLKIFVDQILDLIKFEADKFTLKLETLEFTPWLQEKIMAFESLEAARGKHLHLIVHHDCKLKIDSIQFEKVIYNLLSNALKFSDTGSNIYLEVSADKNTMNVSVRDEGIGMSEEAQKGCFNMFEKSTDNEKNVEGCGIGLALVKEIIEHHGGSISVISEEGHGSEFRISLPVTEMEVLPEPRIIHLNGSDSAESVFEQAIENVPSVLVVEDNSDMMDFIRSGLKREFKVLSATNGEQALTLLETVQPDIIVSDLSMPKMNGLDLLSAVRADSKLCDMPVVMLTGAANRYDEQAAYTSMADDYLTKPFDMQDLKLRLNSILRIRTLLKTKYGSMNVNDIKADEPDFVVKARQLVRDNIQDPSFDSDELSKHLFMTTKTFGRKLDKAIGMSPGLFIRTIRLETARQLILEKNYINKKQLAQSVGFSSASYFTRLIKTQYVELSDF